MKEVRDYAFKKNLNRKKSFVPNPVMKITNLFMNKMVFGISRFLKKMFRTNIGDLSPP